MAEKKGKKEQTIEEILENMNPEMAEETTDGRGDDEEETS